MKAKLAYSTIGLSVIVLIGIAYAQQTQSKSESQSPYQIQSQVFPKVGNKFVLTKELMEHKKAKIRILQDDKSEFELWSKRTREEVSEESAKRLKIIYTILMRKAADEGVDSPSIYWLSGASNLELTCQYTQDDEQYAWFSPISPRFMRLNVWSTYLHYIPSTKEANDGGEWVRGYKSRLETLEKEPDNYPLLVDTNIDQYFSNKGDHQRAMILFTDGSVREVEGANRARFMSAAARKKNDEWSWNQYRGGTNNKESR